MQAIGRQATDFGYYASQPPLVRLIDFSNERFPGVYKIQSGLYCIYIAPVENGNGELLFMALGQFSNTCGRSLPYHTMARALVFHADLIQGTTLASSLKNYVFFNENANKALPLSPQEYQLALDFFANIHLELTQALDRHTKKYLLSMRSKRCKIPIW